MDPLASARRAASLDPQDPSAARRLVDTSRRCGAPTPRDADWWDSFCQRYYAPHDPEAIYASDVSERPELWRSGDVVWYSPPLTLHGDYVGDLTTKANQETLAAELAAADAPYAQVWLGYGARMLLIRADALYDPEDLAPFWDSLERLKGGEVYALDEETEQRLDTKLQSEAWSDWGAQEFREMLGARGLRSDDIEATFHDACEAIGGYGHAEGCTSYVFPLEEAADAVALMPGAYGAELIGDDEETEDTEDDE